MGIQKLINWYHTKKVIFGKQFETIFSCKKTCEMSFYDSFFTHPSILATIHESWKSIFRFSVLWNILSSPKIISTFIILNLIVFNWCVWLDNFSIINDIYNSLSILIITNYVKLSLAWIIHECCILFIIFSN